MKKKLLAILVLVILLVLSTASVSASHQEATAKIEFAKMTLSSPDPYPGQKVDITLDYTIKESAELIEVGYDILLEEQVEEGGNTGQITESGTIKLENVKKEDATGQVKISFFAPTKEAKYNLTVKFDKELAIPVLGPQKIEVYSALPDDLSNLFAGLGIFAAVMVVMAMGTEVIIEMLKSMLGLKAKVTAMEAFNELKAELPGLLAGTGVAAAERKKIAELAENAGKMLTSVQDYTKFVEQIKAGQFLSAYESLNNLTQGIGGQNVAELKEKAKAQITESMAQLRSHLGIPSTMTEDAEKKALDFIEGATVGSAGQLVKDVFGALQESLRKPEDAQKWLSNQADTYINEGGDWLNKILNQGLDEMAGLGIDRAVAQKWFNDALQTVEGVARDKSQVFSVSVRNLLLAVQERRNKIQSPARVLWRRLRDSHIPLWVFNVFYIGLPVGILFGIARWNLPGRLLSALNLGSDSAVIGWVAAILSGLLVGLALWGISALVANMGKEAKKLLGRQAGPSGPSNGTVGHFMRFTFEMYYNRIMGRGANVLDPEQYGEADNEAKGQITNIEPTTIASTLLSLENKHQEEEVKRVRALRVISAVLGTILAYQLKVDAAVYLGYAVPDVVRQINRVDLHAIWSVIPSDFTVGMLLTGLAASAGSKFWRDLLGRLQAARGQAEEAARLVEKVKSAIPELTDRHTQ